MKVNVILNYLPTLGIFQIKYDKVVFLNLNTNKPQDWWPLK